MSLDALGDPTLLPAEYQLATRSEIERLFGDAFAKQLLAMNTEGWFGPVESVYGLHVVRVHERSPASRPELPSVRDVVTRNLVAQRRRQALESAYDELRRRYTIKVDEFKSRKVEESKSRKVGDLTIRNHRSVTL